MTSPPQGKIVAFVVGLGVGQWWEGSRRGEAREEKWMNEHGLFQSKQQFCELHTRYGYIHVD